MSNDRSTKMLSTMRRLGKPPIMAGEDPAEYDQLIELVCAEINPQGIQELLLAKDIVDSEWDILRLRGLKVAMLHAVIPRAVESQSSDASLMPLEFKLAPVIRKHVVAIVAGEKSAKQELEKLLAEHELTLDVITAAAFESTIKPQLHTDHMLEAACKRRNAAYAQLERLRAKNTEHSGALPSDMHGNAPPTMPANGLESLADR